MTHRPARSVRIQWVKRAGRDRDFANCARDDRGASRSKVYDVLRLTEGQRGFWTSDCELDDGHGRFGFLEAPVDLNVSDLTGRRRAREDEGRVGLSRVGTGRRGSGCSVPITTRRSETNVQFRHYDFESSYDGVRHGLHGPVVGDDPRSTGALREDAAWPIRSSRTTVRSVVET